MSDDRMPHDGGIIERLIAENETLRTRLAECQAAVVRRATRAEQAETQLAAVQPPADPEQDEFLAWWSMRPSLTRLQARLIWRKEHKQNTPIFGGG